MNAALMSGPLHDAELAYTVEVETPQELRLEKFWQGGPYCGANSLFCLLRLGGLAVDHEQLIRTLSPPAEGNSLEDLRKAASKLGIQLFALRAGPRDLERLSFPFIAHLKGRHPQPDHFVVVVAFDGKKFDVIDDGVGGIFSIRRERFIRQWSGFVLGRALPRQWLTPLFASVGSLAIALLVPSSWLRSVSLSRSKWA